MNEDELRAGLRAIASIRKEGDGMMRLNRQELALGKWAEGLEKVEALVSRLTQDDSPKDRAEVLGVRAGLLKRLGDDKRALASYQEGAKTEAEAGLGSTYNRLNEIRTALLLNATTIKQAESSLVAVSNVLEGRLNDPKDTEASSDGWLWADFGDVCMLLGRIEEAEKYYRAFARIAGGNEARITRETLALLQKRVTEAKDPDAGRIGEGLAALARATSALSG